MPVYEYRCPACLALFERLESVSKRDEDIECPACGGREAGRLVSVFAAFANEAGQTGGLGGGCCGGTGGGCACRA
jgi:putative FmdB family regulatory protein